MRNAKIKQFALLLGLMLPTALCNANDNRVFDGHSTILVKEAHVENTPKGNSIQASINGHLLIVVFTENLGQVSIDVKDFGFYFIGAEVYSAPMK